MCNNPSFAPIEFLNKHNHITGITIDTIRLIEKKLDYSIMIQHVKTSSVEQSKEFFKKKICDIMPLSVANIYNTEYTYTKPYLHYKPVLITRDNEPFIHSLEDVKYKGIAKKHNPIVINMLKKTYPGINIIETKTDKEAFEKVSSGEIYATVSILPVASYNFTKYGLSNLKIAGHENKDIQFSMAVNDEKNQLVSILNKSLHLKPNHDNIFNLSSSNAYSMMDLAQKVQKVYTKRYNKSIEITINKSDRTTSKDLNVNNSKLINLISYDFHDKFYEEIESIFDLLEGK